MKNIKGISGTRTMLTVIRHASIDAACKLYSKWKREISLEYLSEEKFMLFAATDEYFTQPPSSEEYPFMVCGQTVMLSNPDLAAAHADIQKSLAGLKKLEAVIADKKELQRNLLSYISTKPARDGLKAQKSDKARKAYREQHESDFIIAEAAARYFKAHGITKLPPVGNDQQGLALNQPGQGGLEHRLILRVGVAGGLVQNDDRYIL